jgi:hypothetical protein
VFGSSGVGSGFRASSAGDFLIEIILSKSIFFSGNTSLQAAIHFSFNS